MIRRILRIGRQRKRHGLLSSFVSLHARQLHIENSLTFVFFHLIGLYTFFIYASSSIYVSSEGLIMERFGVGNFKADLGLALYVLGMLNESQNGETRFASWLTVRF